MEKINFNQLVGVRERMFRFHERISPGLLSDSSGDGL